MTNLSCDIQTYALSDRYAFETGRVFLTGTQALVRILFDQARRDRENGLRTGALVSGYRGSPLGGLDQELWRSRTRLAENRIEFIPAVNEDLAATIVLGSQQVETSPDAEVQGVYAMWYGKGPGVDRSGDALKHGNAYGSSPHGGVLVVAGDDHGCVSSSMPHQSDVAFMSWFVPVLNPASVGEYLEYGEYGYALSRFSGMWVGFKAVSETVESGQSVVLRPDRAFAAPDYAPPTGGLHYRWPDLPGPQIEERMEAKKAAVQAFVESNPLDRAVYGVEDASYGIVTTGKGHLDTMEALRLLGVDEALCRARGIDVYKVGMPWPLARRDALAFVQGKREILVIEEKRGIIESQLKEYFYDWPGQKPERMIGKTDERLAPLVPWIGELSPMTLVPIIASRLHTLFPDLDLPARAGAQTAKPPVLLNVPGAVRTPYFCSGCPHNTSTRVPEGSKALAGIGCHFMASWMDRETSSLIQMGGEGVNWAASSRFTGRGHVFQNLGEGTWYHSGSMAIRQAIAARANITYKILYNDAVAMTGGQPVDGPISVQSIAHSVRAEGVERIALVSDMPRKFAAADFPVGLTIHGRADLDAVQRELRAIPGVSVLIYEQTCATEKRRRRKRGTMEDPKTFVLINDLVCEGCGDCSVESNCLSVEPRETAFGRKRKINQSSCNKDFSCLNGFCPSFVTVEGAERRRRAAADIDVAPLLAALPEPSLPPLSEPYDLLVTGVGGTGVVTVGALVTMAAHLQGLGASVLDFTGFAQKFGTVLSYIRLGTTPDAVNQVRVDTGSADAVIGCDIVVTSSSKASVAYGSQTKVVLNRAEMPTGDLVQKRDADLRVDLRERTIAGIVGKANLHAFDANRMAEHLLGDAVFANVMMLGFAWQKGLVPVAAHALDRAIVLNDVAVEANKSAFALGRILAHSPDALPDGDAPAIAPATFEAIVDHRAAFLTDYQDATYADRYRARMTAFRGGLPTALPPGAVETLSAAAARSLFKLMAYKDEYEVARLMVGDAFRAQIEAQFAGPYRLRYHMAPPLLTSGRDHRGRPRKRSFGSLARLAFVPLARMRRLRGTVFDVFGYQADRRTERELIGWFERLMDDCRRSVASDTVGTWSRILAAPMDIRGYGPVKDRAIETVNADVVRLLEECDAVLTATRTIR